MGREIVPLMDPKFRSIRDVVYGASHPPRLNVLGGDGRGFFKLHVVQIGKGRAGALLFLSRVWADRHPR